MSKLFQVTKAILHRIADGDMNAVEDCLRAYGGLVWSIARRFLLSHEDMEDAVQETFVNIWKNAAKFDETQGSEKTFVAMIAQRRLIDRIRLSQRRLSPDAIEDLHSEPAAPSEQKMDTLIDGRRAFRALKVLRSERREAILLSIVDGLSHQQIADETGMPLGTVKTHVRRGLLQARAILGDAPIC